MNGRLLWDVACELVTGRPRLTVRSAAVEFGPPPGAVYEAELSAFSDAELYAHGDEILAVARRYHERRMRRWASQGGGSDRVAAGPNPGGSSSHGQRRRGEMRRVQPVLPGSGLGPPLKAGAGREAR
ncbi:hypothetical protein KZ829_00345 [Actinoplanes hulinensis]|uniref:Uncharacterized protein n=1 Tax=Actinoplanes hulinensis TaxID=1144547 RepID=A0ABS7ATR0_9ACTN|nr:hypothetical protein [Actinoplanes hulinensis]MBW6432195.1 hypothetical protein [Actinoplanes hulinensis]